MKWIKPEDPGYDESRTLFNAMIDRGPAVIAPCSTPADVAEALKYARDHNLAVAVRAGGHSVAGMSLNDGGLVFDVRQLIAHWGGALGGPAATATPLQHRNASWVTHPFGLGETPQGGQEAKARVKRAFDPENTFRGNQNIRPACPDTQARSTGQSHRAGGSSHETVVTQPDQPTVGDKSAWAVRKRQAPGATAWAAPASGPRRFSCCWS